MEEFLPSEIARAVYGYLLAEGCEAAAKTFLETSPNLSECMQLVKRGRRISHANTLLLGRSLIDVLNIVCNIHSLVLQANEKKKKSGQEEDEDSMSNLFDQLRSFLLAETGTLTNRSSRGNTSGEQQSSVANRNSRPGNNDGKKSILEENQDTFQNSEKALTPILTLDSLVQQEESGLSLPVSQESQDTEVSSPNLTIHKKISKEKRHSLAEDYKSLAQECSEGLDLSSSPDKSLPRNKNIESSHSQHPQRPISAPGALVLPELEMENQSAIAAITGMTFGAPQVSPQLIASSVSHAHLNLPSTHVFTSNTSTPNLISLSSGVITVPSHQTIPQHVLTSSVLSHTVPTSTLPGSLSQPIVVPAAGSLYAVEGISRLPDPPIILLNNQNQPVVDNQDPSTSYFGMPPTAASTPHAAHRSSPLSISSHLFNPEDTACIIYPPLSSGKPVKRASKTLRKSTRLRKILPKPPRKDPPNIIHIRVLPQTEEVLEEEVDDPLADVEHGDLANPLANLTKKEPEQTEVRPIMEVQNEILHEEKDLEGEENLIIDENVTEETDIVESNAEEKVTSQKTRESPPNKEKEIKTPKPPVIKKNISRSTPRRHSHVRALSFNTPNKPIVNRKSNTSPKMPRIKFSPRSSKLSSIKRSSLFKSPTSPKNNKELAQVIEEEEITENKEEEESNEEVEETVKSSQYQLPIATRSPAPKLSSAWKEVNDVTISEKPIWDEKLRSFICGDFIDPAPPPKKQSKGKPKEKANASRTSKRTTKAKTPQQSSRRSSRLLKIKETPAKSLAESNSTGSPMKSPDNRKKDGISMKSPAVPKNSETPLKNSLEKENNDICTESEKSPVKELPVSPIAGPSKIIKKIRRPLQRRTVAGRVGKRRQAKIVSREEVSSSTSDSSIVDLNKSNSNHSSENTNINSTSPSKNHSKSEDSIKIQPEVEKEDSNVSSSTHNVLLEDLVVSSNSCFPQANEEVGNEPKTQPCNKGTKEITFVIDKSGTVEPNKDSKVQCAKNGSPKFAFPLPIHETPLKELHPFTPQTPAFNTPLLKNIRQEYSILEEDLLLTPSLPPTPQVSSPGNPARTPCKPVILSPSANKLSVTIDKNKMEETASSQNVSTNVTCLTNSNVESSKRNINSDSSSYSSDEELMNIINVPKPKASLPPNVKIRTRVIEGGKIRRSQVIKPKVSIYTTTESSDDEVRSVLANKVKNDQPKTSLSKLASMLLESEKKKLYVKPKNVTKSKRTKSPTKKAKAKKDLNQSESITSVNSSQETKVSPKKNVNEEIDNIDENKDKAEGQKSTSNSPKSKDKEEKQSTPEVIRQQLQSDLLKRERFEIFGDRFSTSDSDIDIEIFEKKKAPSKHTQPKKVVPKSRKSVERMVVSDDSSVEPDNIVKENCGKSVRFESLPQVKVVDQSNSSDNFVQVVASLNTNNMRLNNPDHSNEKEENRTVEVIKAVNSIPGIQCPNTKTTDSRNIDESLLEEGNSRTSISSDKNKEKEAGCLGDKDKLVVNSSSDISSSVDKNIRNKCNFGVDKDFDVSSTMDKALLEDEKGQQSEVDSSGNGEELPKNNVPCPPTPYTVSSPFQEENASMIQEMSCFGESEEVEGYVQVVVRNKSLSSPRSNPVSAANFNPEYSVSYEISDNDKIFLSYSKTFLHFSIPEQNEKPQVKPSKSPSEQPSKENAVKRRIKLTPVCESKYEQKLQVDYDVVDGKIIKKRDVKRASIDADCLEVSCSTIDTDLTSDVGSKSVKSVVSFFDEVEDLRGRINNNKGITQMEVKKSEFQNQEKYGILNKDVTTIHSSEKINENKLTTIRNSQAHEKSFELKELKAHDIITDFKCPTETRRHFPREERSHKKEHDGRTLNDTMEGEKKKSRTHSDRKGYRPSHRRRDSSPKKYGERCDRHGKYYSSRGFGACDHRGYSEKRPYSPPHSNSRRDCPTSSRSRRNERHDKYKSCSARVHGDGRSRKSAESLFVKSLLVDYDDVDKVEERGKKNRIERDEQFIDPRANQMVTYSDIEKNETSNEAASLMDFAIMSKTKDKRVTFKSSETFIPITDCKEDEPPQTSKRKVSDNTMSSPESSQTNKKLKLAEVDMKEAKSVLKHKMADMLNVLHPDTSNEAS